MTSARLPRRRATRTSKLALLVASVVFVSPAHADRPSLVELQATLDAHLMPPPAATAGTIRFVDSSIDVTFNLVDLVLSADVNLVCTIGCGPGTVSFASVRATFEQSSDLALLVAASLPSGTIQDVRVSIPSQTDVLHFQSVQVQSLSADAVVGRTVAEFDFAVVSMSWQSVTSEWNTQTQTGAGCTIPANEIHVELAGNSPANLQSGEIESVHHLGLVGGTGLATLSASRTPPNPCYLRSAGSALLFDAEFHRLWSSNDQFPATRQFVEDLVLTNTFIDLWTLHVESGALREEIHLYPKGNLVIREFSPVDGSITAVQTVGF